MATQTDVLVYHLPEVDGESKCVRRVTRCPFTGLLQHLRFDSAFIHALTETGIETYSSRGLAEALRDVEGFTPLNNVIDFVVLFSLDNIELNLWNLISGLSTYG